MFRTACIQYRHRTFRFPVEQGRLRFVYTQLSENGFSSPSNIFYNISVYFGDTTGVGVFGGVHLWLTLCISHYTYPHRYHGLFCFAAGVMYDFEPSCWGQIVLTWGWELSWSWLISHSYICCPCVHKSTSRGPLETHYVLWTPVSVLLQCSVRNFDYLEFLVWTRVHFFTFSEVSSRQQHQPQGVPELHWEIERCLHGWGTDWPSSRICCPCWDGPQSPPVQQCLLLACSVLAEAVIILNRSWQHTTIFSVLLSGGMLSLQSLESLWHTNPPCFRTLVLTKMTFYVLDSSDICLWFVFLFPHSHFFPSWFWLKWLSFTSESSPRVTAYPGSGLRSLLPESL